MSDGRPPGRPHGPALAVPSRSAGHSGGPAIAVPSRSAARPTWTVAFRLVVVLLVATMTLVPVSGASPGAPDADRQSIDLEVDAPDAVEPGAEFEVEFRVTNAGAEPTNATGLTLTDYPDAVEVVEIRTDGTKAEQQDSVFWTDPVEPGETVSATYVFRLSPDAAGESVTIDAKAATDEEERRRSITVSVDRNGPPIAAIDVEGDPAVGGEPVTLSATDSLDPDGEVVRYEWDLTGDGSVDATGEEITHAFEQAGEITVTLTVTDDGGATNSTTVELAVEPQDAVTATDTATPTASDPVANDPGDDSGLLSPSALVVYALGGLLVYALTKY